MKPFLSILLAATLLGAPAQANDLDRVFETIQDRVGTHFGGNRYAHNTDLPRRSLRWACETCDRKQEIKVGLYDFEENYLTTDTAKVMRMVTGGCGYTGCVTRPYTRDTLRGLIQTGEKRGRIAKRTVLFLNDRMLMVEVRGTLTAQIADTLHTTVEDAVLSELINAR